MKTILFTSVLITSTFAHALVPQKVVAAAAKMKTNQVRTVVVETHENNACDAGYNIEVQVNLAERVGEDGQIAHHWQTVKVVNANSDGQIMEICEE